MTREELISYYEKQLEKVKASYANCVNQAMAAEYIKQAEIDLIEVKNGREW